MTRLEEQRQAVSQALENQDQRISAIETYRSHVKEQLQQVKDHVNEMFREFRTDERSLTAAAPDFLDRHSGVVAKPYPYDGKTSWGVYYLQFEKISRMNNWSSEEKACAAEGFCSSYFEKSIFVRST
nr:unnamed protein product [Callosobruchus chinensis]CAH7769454.1 unnamed protein product [Callosobruchus chinensis]